MKNCFRLSTISQPQSLAVSKTLHDEEILLQKIARGDYRAFWKVWLFYRKYLYQCCLHWMNNNSIEAEDALSLTMLKAYEKLPQYAAKIIHLKAWLRQLCHHLCLDLHRKAKRIGTWVEMANDSLNSSSTPPLLEIAISWETYQAINQAVDKLPSQLQQPFKLRCYEDRAYADIAQQLSLSLCNTRKRVQQARIKVKQQLGEYLRQES